MSQTIFEKTQPGQHAYSLPKDDLAFHPFLPEKNLSRQTPLALPEISELDLTRHFCAMAKRTGGIDTQFYPLGSCTMKFNPRVNEWAAALPGFRRTHPLAPETAVQGNLQIIFELIELLCQLTGMQGGTVLPNAGAQGEFVGIQMIRAFHAKRQDSARSVVLVPDNAHGTNPATASMAGYTTRAIPTNAKGDLDLDALRKAATQTTAALMLTNPNTLGLFSSHIQEIAAIVHAAGGLLYYDGANLNPILNIARPGAMGFDVMHINLHKTFSTPHGGGGPGSGPVLCNKQLIEFLPVPRVEKNGGEFKIVWQDFQSSGQIASFHGNFSIYLRAYLYAKLHGHRGFRKIAEGAVLNANYLKSRMQNLFTIPYPGACMHEFAVQADNYLDQGVRALDIAKRMLDYGIHAPTIYFPLIVKECMLIEPTESESKATLDRFIEIMHAIVQEIKTAPHSTPVGRLDETRAAKTPILKN